MALKSSVKFCQNPKKFWRCTFVSPIHSFSWRETKLFAREVKVQIGKSTIERYSIKGKSADSGGK